MNVERRSHALRHLRSDRYDLLVIGGGVVGAGAALDAATRGLRVGLIEQSDWASGTSSRSSKLIHGGLRYLEMGDLKLVHEALTERSILLNRTAPHLTTALAFLYPLRGGLRERLKVGVGVALYDLLRISVGQSRMLSRIPYHRHLTRGSAMRKAPCLNPSVVSGAVQYYDAQLDDARHTFELVRTAVSYGVDAASRVEATGLDSAEEEYQRVLVRDRDTGVEFTIEAREVLNATGVWSALTQELFDTAGLQVSPSRGVHIVVPSDRLSLNTAMITRTKKSVLFFIPFGSHWVIGTTDTSHHGPLNEPPATRDDVEYLLRAANEVLATKLSRDDVTAVYAGLRPLITGSSTETVRLSREHVVRRHRRGLTTIAGGKYTTYRVMAADAVDEVVRSLPGRGLPTRSARLALLGANGFEEARGRSRQLAENHKLPVSTVEHLLHRYGSLTSEVLAVLETDLELRRGIPGTENYLMVEALYAVTHEDAHSLADVLTRRTRVSLESWDMGRSAAGPVAELIGNALGWDAKRREHEVRSYTDAVIAVREAAGLR